MDQKEPPAVVVYGTDEQRRRRAGTFTAEHAQVAAKKAQEARLVCATLAEYPSLAEAAASLQRGDLSKPGPAFVPIVVSATYEKILRAAGAAVRPTAPTLATQAEGAERRPATWDQIDLGHAVLVEDPPPEYGWYEATVIEKLGDDEFRVRYRDYPGFPPMVRRRSQMALLPLND